MGGLVGEIKGNNAAQSPDGPSAGLQFEAGQAAQLFGIVADVGGNKDGIASAFEVYGLGGKLSGLVEKANGKLKISDIKDVRLRDAATYADSLNTKEADGYLTQDEITNIQNATINNIVGSDQAGWQTPE